jgi:hypothetical protein
MSTNEIILHYREQVREKQAECAKDAAKRIMALFPERYAKKVDQVVEIIVEEFSKQSW